MTTSVWPQTGETAERILLTSAPWPGGTDAEVGFAWDAVALARKALDGWVPAESRIRGDTSLTGLGVQQQLEAAMPQFVAILDRARAALESGKVQATTQELALLEPLKAKDPMEQGRFQEIRTWLGRLGPEDRAMTVLRRLAAKDAEFCRAVHDAPAAFELIDAEQRAQLGQVLLAQSDARKYGKWRLLTAQLGVAEFALEVATQRITGSLGLSDAQVRNRDADEAMAARLTVV
jgi:hypothetical protein